MKFIPIILVFIIFSCSIEKRYHRVGWNFQYHAINTSLKIKKSKNSTHEFSENKTITSNYLDTTSSEKIDAIHISKIVSNEHEKDSMYLTVEKETSNTWTQFIAHKKKKSALSEIFLREDGEKLPNFRKTNKHSDAFANVKQPNYFEESSSLWSAFIITGVIGIIVLLIAALMQSALLLIISQVLFFIAGLLLFLAIFSFLICLITFGMIC